MAEAKHQRIVMLNRLVSRSITRAPQGHMPATHAGSELFEIIEKKFKDGHAIEFFDAVDDLDDDDARIKANIGCNFVRIVDFKKTSTDNGTYINLLVIYADQTVRVFPVVDIVKYEGRELSGAEHERGVTSAHVSIRLPKGDDHDDGTYRCVIEAVPNITRQVLEALLSRPLRRYAKTQDWHFDVSETAKGQKAKNRKYAYHPKLELFADVGRSLAALGERTLSHLVFTKRSEKQSVAQATAVIHDDVFADVELRISAKQGPEDKALMAKWADWLKDSYEKKGYTTRMYFRHAGNLNITGAIHPALEGATDLLMCPREIIETVATPKKWLDKIQPEVCDILKSLLDKDELWERAK